MKPKKMTENARFPEKLWGSLMISAMNKRHSELSEWGLSLLDGEFKDAADIGCGGGVNVMRLTKICKGKVFGVDISPLCVKRSKRKCARLIKSGKVKIIEGSASKLPFPENSFDLITAFETVYFWNDTEKDFREIYRALNSGGVFLIVNELTAEVDNPDKYEKLKSILPINIFTVENLTEKLYSANFTSVTSERYGDWSAIIAKK